ncbi:MAG: TIGR02452 family protein [Verrucomicrobia bacterium]|nr:TIGR02452 family protein [Verrucomicrobiota bacterium]
MNPAKAITHDAAAWAKGYKSSEKDIPAQKSMLAKVFKQTQEAVKNGFSVNGKQIKISPDSIKKMQTGSLLIEHPKPVAIKNPHKKTNVTVRNGDTIAVASELQQNGAKVVALNMANAHHPGGGVEHGARAQEESIFRASNYHQSLYREENKTLDVLFGKKAYHVPTTGGIYSPSVSVFRKPIQEGFAFQEPVELDFIASAAFNLNHNKDKPKDYDKQMLEKIRGIFRIAAGTGHDTMVLGAFGCGAFKNDPKKVSALFKQVIQEKEFKGAFSTIVFAVINDHAGKQNFEAFDKAFKNFTI